MFLNQPVQGAADIGGGFAGPGAGGELVDGRNEHLFYDGAGFRADAQIRQQAPLRRVPGRVRCLYALARGVSSPSAHEPLSAVWEMSGFSSLLKTLRSANSVGFERHVKVIIEVGAVYDTHSKRRPIRFLNASISGRGLETTT